jgi:hypothetical protein
MYEGFRDHVLRSQELEARRQAIREGVFPARLYQGNLQRRNDRNMPWPMYRNYHQVWLLGGILYPVALDRRIEYDRIRGRMSIGRGEW